MVTVTDLVEKPVPGEAPSRWIIIGRYVLRSGGVRRAARDRRQDAAGKSS